MKPNQFGAAFHGVLDSPRTPSRRRPKKETQILKGKDLRIASLNADPKMIRSIKSPIIRFGENTIRTKPSPITIHVVGHPLHINIGPRYKGGPIPFTNRLLKKRPFPLITKELWERCSFFFSHL
jgi:hypothetical protein